MSTPQTDTPETDATAYDVIYRGDMGCTLTASDKEPGKDGDHVSADFARALERRAIAAEARVKELESAILFKETCQTCNAPCDPADVEAGECIWCIVKQFKRERDEARAALRLRPIAEAGPVPEGAVRLWVFYTGGNWVFKPWKDNADTHFIDIYPPQ